MVTRDLYLGFPASQSPTHVTRTEELTYAAKKHDVFWLLWPL
jgi:hypothetical protein